MTGQRTGTAGWPPDRGIQAHTPAGAARNGLPASRPYRWTPDTREAEAQRKRAALRAQAALNVLRDAQSALAVLADALTVLAADSEPPSAEALHRQMREENGPPPDWVKEKAQEDEDQGRAWTLDPGSPHGIRATEPEGPKRHRARPARPSPQPGRCDRCGYTADRCACPTGPRGRRP